MVGHHSILVSGIQNKPTLVLFPVAVEVVQEKGFHLDLEDYLAGVLIMASELVSLLLICYDVNSAIWWASTSDCTSFTWTYRVNKHSRVISHVSQCTFQKGGSTESVLNPELLYPLWKTFFSFDL